MVRFVGVVTALLVSCTAGAPVPRAPEPGRPLIPATGSEPAAGPSHAARITDHVDGDTFEVLVGSRSERVRFIGVDTPERGLPGFAEASSFTARAAPAGATVFLELDVEQRDRYGRLLAYVWLERSGAHAARDMLNARLVATGRAATLAIPPNVAYVDLLADLQRRARARGLGIWAAVVGCDGSYPDVCIPPPPPDLDCAQITFRNFAVRGRDPHRFDEDRNGRGCES